MLKWIILPIGFCLCTAQTAVAEVKSLKCELLSMSMTADGQANTIGKSDIKKMSKSLPEKCRHIGYTYGNGVINFVPYSQRCQRAFIKAGQNKLKPMGYPMKYDLKNSIMTWAFKGAIMDPSFGTARAVTNNKLNLATIVMTQNIKLKIVGSNWKMSATSVCE